MAPLTSKQMKPNTIAIDGEIASGINGGLKSQRHVLIR